MIQPTEKKADHTVITSRSKVIGPFSQLRNSIEKFEKIVVPIVIDFGLFGELGGHND